MARRKLNAFTADDAGDRFTPTVKTLKSDAGEEVFVEKRNETVESSSIKETPAGEREIAKVHLNAEEMRGIGEEHLTDKLVHLVGFALGEEEFGLDIQRIQEINRMTEITRVPRTPEFVMGVINLRGKVIPVINLRRRFGMPSKERTKDTRIIIVEIRDRPVGILVDSVSEVIRIPNSTIESAPDIVMGIDTQYIDGIGKLQDRLLIVLNIDKVLSQEEVEQIEKGV